jgi:TPR repeat protein
MLHPSKSNCSHISLSSVAAAKWFGVASEMGDVGGMVSYGALLLKGLGVPANITEAVRLFKKVACSPSFAC